MRIIDHRDLILKNIQIFQGELLFLGLLALQHGEIQEGRVRFDGEGRILLGYNLSVEINSLNLSYAVFFIRYISVFAYPARGKTSSVTYYKLCAITDSKLRLL